MPAPKQPNFRYDQLSDSTKHIRLLQLLPARKDGQLQFRLSTVELSTAPAYKALSYEWGTPGKVEVILVDDVVFYVQRNLYDFLEQLHARYRDELPIHIWVDAVCISQDTDDVLNREKNHQVRLMGRIYSEAEIVLACLGKLHDVQIPLVKPALQWCLNILRDKPIFTSSRAGWVSEGDWAALAKRTVVEKMASNADDDVLDLRGVPWDLLENLAAKSYWKRLWIIQELMLAQKYEISCASQNEDTCWLTKEELFAAYSFIKEFQWAVHPAALELLRDPGRDRSHPGANLLGRTFTHSETLLKRSDDIRSFVSLGHALWAQDASDRTLEQLVRSHSDSACSDPHDHVYSLLGLAKDVTETSPFDVDYACDLFDLMIYTILWCRSSNALVFGHILMDVLNGRTHIDGIPEDITSFMTWAESLPRKLQPWSAALRSVSVSIRLDEPQSIEGGPLVRFWFHDFTWTFEERSLRFQMICERVGDHFRLAEVEDPTDKLVVGRNSDSVLKSHFLEGASTLYVNRSKDPACYCMDVTIADLMHILIIETMTWTKARLEANSPAPQDDLLPPLPDYFTNGHEPTYNDVLASS